MLFIYLIRVLLLILKLVLRYVLTFSLSLGTDTTGSNINHFQDFVPSEEIVLGDNWSPFDLQIYGKYYESVSACELQPQNSKRLYINGGLLDVSFDDDKVIESSVIPVPDHSKVVLAGQRTATRYIYDSSGTCITGTVSETATTNINQAPSDLGSRPAAVVFDAEGAGAGEGLAPKKPNLGDDMQTEL